MIQADGTEKVGPKEESSLRDYLFRMLKDTTGSDNKRRLAADMLYYGAAAQTYFNYDTEHLVTATEDPEEQALLAEFHTPTEPEAPEAMTFAGDGAELRGSVVLGNRVILSVTMKADAGLENLTLVVAEQGGSGAAERIAMRAHSFLPGVYVGESAGFTARKMRVAYDVYVEDANGNAVSQTMTWSVARYLADLRTDPETNAKQISLFNALLTYGDAVKAYMEAPYGSFQN